MHFEVKLKYDVHEMCVDGWFPYTRNQVIYSLDIKT